MLLSLPPQVLIILAFCLIFALTFHEFSHAYTAVSYTHLTLPTILLV